MLLSRPQRINCSPSCIRFDILNRAIEWQNNGPSYLMLEKDKKFRSNRVYLTIRGESIAFVGPRIHGNLPLSTTSEDIRCLELFP